MSLTLSDNLPWPLSLLAWVPDAVAPPFFGTNRVFAMWRGSPVSWVMEERRRARGLSLLPKPRFRGLSQRQSERNAS